MIDFWGDPVAEFKPPPELALRHRPELLFLEFGPTADRPWITYATATVRPRR